MVWLRISGHQIFYHLMKHEMPVAPVTEMF
jgi:hypothetical protein